VAEGKIGSSKEEIRHLSTLLKVVEIYLVNFLITNKVQPYFLTPIHFLS